MEGILGVLPPLYVPQFRSPAMRRPLLALLTSAAACMFTPAVADEPVTEPAAAVEGEALIETVVEVVDPYLPAEPRHQSPLVRKAASYVQYHQDMTAIQFMDITGLSQLNAALDKAARHNVKDVGEGALAYAALIAVQTPEFVDEIRKVADAYGAEAVIRGVSIDTRYASTLKGADLATAAIVQAFGEDTMTLRSAGGSFRNVSNVIQKDNWAKARENSRERANRLEALAFSPRSTSSEVLVALAAPGVMHSGRVTDDAEALKAAFREALQPSNLNMVRRVSYSSSMLPTRVNPTRANFVQQALTIAALDVVGALDSSNESIYAALYRDGNLNFCMDMARKKMNMCVSAARERWEDPFCVGQHAMTDIADCLAEFTAR